MEQIVKESDEAFAEWFAEEFGFPMELTEVSYLGSIRSAWEHGVLFEKERMRQVRKDRDKRRAQRRGETARRRQEFARAYANHECDESCRDNY